MEKNNEKFYSVVIPTMWKSNRILSMLNILENSKYVKEIILIDNNPEEKPNLSPSSKLIYYTENKNIFVNPAWNKGFELSNYDLILCNDDIEIPNIDDVLFLISKSEYDFIGISFEESSELKILDIDIFPNNGYGSFIFVKNYIKIPEEYKIYKGDFILFQNNEKKGILYNPNLIGERSVTLKTDPKLYEIARKDLINYKEKDFIK
jgi:hypothetical protein